MKPETGNTARNKPRSHGEHGEETELMSFNKLDFRIIRGFEPWSVFSVSSVSPWFAFFGTVHSFLVSGRSKSSRQMAGG
jgi:hypothetical protein